MADLQRVSPRTIVESSLPFEIVLVAEGFLAGEEQAFSAMCDSLVDAFLGTPPFSLLNANPWRIRFWRHFSVGTHHGAALGSTPGDTLLGATYDQATQQLTFDQARVASFVGGTRIPMAPGLSLPLALVARDTWSHWGMMAVLLPPYAGTQRLTADADTSVLPAGATPPAKPWWFVATTLDDGWERVVIEAAARCLGLDDEWSRTEPAFAAPSASERLALCYSPNLFAGTPPTGVPTGAFPWNQELDAAALAKAIRRIRSIKASASAQLSARRDRHSPMRPTRFVESGLR